MNQVPRRGFFPGWRTKVMDYCKQCPECSSYHKGELPKNAPLQPIQVGAPFERMSIDLTGPHPRTQEGYYIFSLVLMYSQNGLRRFPFPTKRQQLSLEY